MPRMSTIRRRCMRVWPVAFLALSCMLHGACGGSEPQLEKAIQVLDVVTGWFDAGIVSGQQNKLVPTITFRVKNNASTTISYVSFNAVFRVINDPEELGAALLKGIDRKGLDPGQTTEPYVARSQLGYTSPAPRMEMLQHSQFKDAQVELFAKHGSRGWVKLGEYKVQRQLLTR